MDILEPDEYRKNYNSISDSIDKKVRESIKIVCVSKSHPIEALENANKGGLTIFGENYVQEMTDKYKQLDEKIRKDIEWHFIGHLQTNKVKYIAPFVDVIHSVYKLKLAKEIDKRAKENERIIELLLQVNTSGEDSKSGCEYSEAEGIIRESSKLENIRLIGLMTISGLESNDDERKKQFASLRELRDKIENNLKIKLPQLSMGMTSDYHEAIEEGATMIRIGTAIFGKREYK